MLYENVFGLKKISKSAMEILYENKGSKLFSSKVCNIKKINKTDSKMEIKGIQSVKERRVKKIQSRLCAELEIIQYHVFLPYWLIM